MTSRCAGEMRRRQSGRACPAAGRPMGCWAGLDLSGHGGSTGSLALLMDPKDMPNPGLGGVRSAGWRHRRIKLAAPANKPRESTGYRPTVWRRAGARLRPGPISNRAMSIATIRLGWAPGTNQYETCWERISIGEGTSDAAAAQPTIRLVSGYDVAYGDKQTQKADFPDDAGRSGSTPRPDGLIIPGGKVPNHEGYVG